MLSRVHWSLALSASVVVVVSTSAQAADPVFPSLGTAAERAHAAELLGGSGLGLGNEVRQSATPQILPQTLPAPGAAVMLGLAALTRRRRRNG